MSCLCNISGRTSISDFDQCISDVMGGKDVANICASSQRGVHPVPQLRTLSRSTPTNVPRFKRRYQPTAVLVTVGKVSVICRLRAHGEAGTPVELE